MVFSSEIISDIFFSNLFFRRELFSKVLFPNNFSKVFPIWFLCPRLSEGKIPGVEIGIKAESETNHGTDKRTDGTRFRRRVSQYYRKQGNREMSSFPVSWKVEGGWKVKWEIFYCGNRRKFGVGWEAVIMPGRSFFAAFSIRAFVPIQPSLPIFYSIFFSIRWHYSKLFQSGSEARKFVASARPENHMKREKREKRDRERWASIFLLLCLWVQRIVHLDTDIYRRICIDERAYSLYSAFLLYLFALYSWMKFFDIIQSTTKFPLPIRLFVWYRTIFLYIILLIFFRFHFTMITMESSEMKLGKRMPFFIYQFFLYSICNTDFRRFANLALKNFQATSFFEYQILRVPILWVLIENLQNFTYDMKIEVVKCGKLFLNSLKCPEDIF